MWLSPRMPCLLSCPRRRASRRRPRESGDPGLEWYRAPCARSQQLIAVSRTAGGFLSLLVQRQFCREQNWARKARPQGPRQGWRGSKKPKKARPGWRKLSRYASGSAGKPGAHVSVRPFALPLAALTPRLRGFGSRAAPTRHPVAAGQAQTSLSAPLRALAQSLAGLGCAIRVF
jgi:hypothetical protein